MNRRSSKLFGAPLLLVVAACSSSTVDKPTPIGPAPMFKPTGDTYTLKSKASDGAFGLDDLANTDLVIDMAAPPSAVHSWAPTACYIALPANFIIGQATCIKGSTQSVTLFAGNARQICSSNATAFGAAVGPTQAIPAFTGCQEVDIKVKGYDPPLALTAIQRNPH